MLVAILFKPGLLSLAQIRKVLTKTLQYAALTSLIHTLLSSWKT